MASAAVFGFLAAPFAGLTSEAMAQTAWTGATNTDWSTGTNWSVGAPGVADTAVINAPAAANQPVVIAPSTVDVVQMLAGTLRVQSDLVVITSFDQSGGGVTVTGSGSLTGTANISGGTFFTQAGSTLSGPLNVSGGTANNAGQVVGLTTITGGSLSNSGTLAGVNNGAAGSFYNLIGGTAGAVTNAGTATNSGTVASLTNSGGTFNNFSAGTVSGLTNITGGTVVNSGTLDDVDNAAGAVFRNLSGGLAGNLNNAGTAYNAGTLVDVSNSALFRNLSGGVANAVTNTGTGYNSGTIATLTNDSGVFRNLAAGTVSGTTTVNGGTVYNAGSLAGVTTAGPGVFRNLAGGTAGDLLNGGTTFNAGSVGAVNSSGVFRNLTGGTAGAVTNTGVGYNMGTMASLTNGGGVFNNLAGGSVTGLTVINSGVVFNAGTLQNVSTAAPGTFYNLAGGMAGDLTNAGTTYNAGTVGTVGNTGTFTNLAGGSAGALTNSGTAFLAGTVLSVTNTGQATLLDALSVTNDFSNSGTTFVVGDATVGGLFSNSGVLDMTANPGANTLNVGSYAGGGTLVLNVDALDNSGASDDHLAVAGATSGDTIVNFSEVNGLNGLIFADRTLITVGGASNGTFTEGAGLADVGFVSYQLVQVGSNWVLQTVLDADQAAAILGGIGTSISSANFAFSTTTRSAISSSTREREPGSFGYGVWTRLAGGTFEANNSGSLTGLGGAIDQDFAANMNILFGGVQVGADVARFDLGDGGWSGYLGLTGGMMTGRAKTLTTTINYTMPFVGLYGALQNDHFAFDGLVRRDFWTGGFDSTGLSSDIKGRGWTAQFSGEYSTEMGEYLVSIGGAVFYSRTLLDPMSTANGVIQSAPLESLIGKATVSASKALWQAETSAVFGQLELGITHDFKGGVTTTVDQTAIGGSASPLTATTAGYGTQGLVGGALTWVDVAKDFTLQLKAQGRFGKTFKGATAALVLRKNF